MNGVNGIFYTAESDVNYIVTSTLAINWLWQYSDILKKNAPNYFVDIRSHTTREKPLIEFRQELQRVDRLDWLYEFCGTLPTITVLDPAVGCGNFLYAAHDWFRQIELIAIDRITELSGNSIQPKVSIKQMHGMDIDPIACEICKRVLLIAEQEKIPQHYLQETEKYDRDGQPKT